MGRNKSKQRSQFVDTKIQCNGSQTFHHCIYCIKAKEIDPSVQVENVIGSVHGLQSHLNKCSYTPLESKHSKARKRLSFSGYTRRLSRTPSPYRNSRSPSSIDRRKNRRTSQEPSKGFYLTEEDKENFFHLLVEFQAENSLPDSFIERGSTIRLLEFLNPLITSDLPSRRILGGKLLQKVATKAEAEQKKALQNIQKLTKGRVNFVSDVWMNQSKIHLLGCQLTLWGKIANIGLLPTGKRHDGLALAQMMEKIMYQANENEWNIGAVITDNAGQCSRARRILALRWPRVVFLKCFAHDVNNLVKAVLKMPSFHQVAAQASTIVTSINLSSSKWLVATREAMTQTYGFHRSLISLCSTRWNTMQACFASLLRMKTALKVLSATYAEEKDFPIILKELQSQEFWSSLREAETVIRPLCLASFKLQENENTLADVVVCYRNLFDHFQKTNCQDDLVPLIEQRWCSCEQPLFMLAYYLHPAFATDARSLPSTGVSGIASLYNIAKYYYEKLIGGEIGPLRGDLYEWIIGKYCDAALTDFAGGKIPPIPAFWNCVKLEKPASVLPDLALVILSITANTATCERYFSELALIHTARRNRMSSGKSRQISIIRKYVRDRNKENTINQTEIPPPKRIVCSIEPQTLNAVSTPGRPKKSGRSYATSMSCEITPVELGVTTRAGSVDCEEDDPGEPESVDIWSAVFDDWESEINDIINPGMSLQVEKDQLQPYPEINDQNFPQEVIHPQSIRSRSATLYDLFGPQAS